MYKTTKIQLIIIIIACISISFAISDVLEYETSWLGATVGLGIFFFTFFYLAGWLQVNKK